MQSEVAFVFYFSSNAASALQLAMRATPNSLCIRWQLGPFMRSITQLLSSHISQSWTCNRFRRTNRHSCFNIRHRIASNKLSIYSVPSFIERQTYQNYTYRRMWHRMMWVICSRARMKQKLKFSAAAIAIQDVIGMHTTNGCEQNILFQLMSPPPPRNCRSLCVQCEIVNSPINHFGFEDAPLSCILIQRHHVDVCASGK